MNIMRKLYVDTCLIIAYFHANEPNNQHQRSINFFERLDLLDNIELFISEFTVTEFTVAEFGDKSNIISGFSTSYEFYLLDHNEILLYITPLNL